MATSTTDYESVMEFRNGNNSKIAIVLEAVASEKHGIRYQDIAIVAGKSGVTAHELVSVFDMIRADKLIETQKRGPKGNLYALSGAGRDRLKELRVPKDLPDFIGMDSPPDPDVVREHSRAPAVVHNIPIQRKENVVQPPVEEEEDEPEDDGNTGRITPCITPTASPVIQNVIPPEKADPTDAAWAGFYQRNPQAAPGEDDDEEEDEEDLEPEPLTAEMPLSPLQAPSLLKPSEMDGVRICPDLCLPIGDFVTSCIGIIGKRGRGKTGLAKVIMEELSRHRMPFVALDPIGILWGIRFSFDGKGPGCPVLIIGGAHGDIALDVDNGRELAEMIVSKNVSCVIDLSKEPRSVYRAFMMDFTAALFSANDTPRVVIMEEASELVPQKVWRGDIECYKAIEKLVSKGRNVGLGSVMISQRAATINKDVLTQIDALFIFGLVGPQDRFAMGDWVKGRDDERKLPLFEKGIAALRTQEAWYWSPEAFGGAFRRIRVRNFDTYHPDQSHLYKHSIMQMKRTPENVLEEISKITIERKPVPKGGPGGKCRFCSKLFHNGYALHGHENRCKENPNRKSRKVSAPAKPASSTGTVLVLPDGPVAKKKVGRPGLSPEIREKVVEMIRSGASEKEISEKLKLHRNTIVKIKKFLKAGKKGAT